MMFLWIAIFLLVVFAFGSKSEILNHAASNRPKSILQERYANGDINRQEYLRILITLEISS
jgi:uncharacterized membrane protein